MSPEKVGLSANGHRRVSGLRREEVAQLAEVSPDYYVRIEQGRQLPSEQVTRALARALRPRRHRNGISFRSGEATPRVRRCGRSPEAAGLALQTLLDQWTTTPAWISDRCTDCIAANALATELNPSFKRGRNTLRDMILQEEESARSSSTTRSVSQLRSPRFGREREAISTIRRSPRMFASWSRTVRCSLNFGHDMKSDFTQPATRSCDTRLSGGWSSCRRP